MSNSLPMVSGRNQSLAKTFALTNVKAEFSPYATINMLLQLAPTLAPHTMQIFSARFALALFTLAFIVVTFYFPLYGLGTVLDQSKSFAERWEGSMMVLPSIAMLLFLAGMFPTLRGPVLLWLGIVATALLALPAIQFARSGFPAAFGCIAALIYSAAWWRLAQSRLTIP